MGDPLCSLGNFQIPRPKCIGMEFVAIKGTHSGFYRTINKNIAFKYGISQQRTFGVSTRRPSIPKEWTNIKKNNNENEERESSKSNNGSISEENEVASEPLPDYEVEEREENISERKDKISVKNDLTPTTIIENNEEMSLLKCANNTKEKIKI